MQRYIETFMEKTATILEKEIDLLKKLVNILLEKKTLDRRELQQLVDWG